MKISLTGRSIALENLRDFRLTRRKILIAVLLTVIAIPDVVFDTLFSLVHVGFEWVEYGLEEFFEHFFHTTRHESQIITVYLLLAVGLFIGYRLYRAFPRLCRRTRERLIALWSRETAEAEAYWQALPAGGKVKVAAASALGAACLLFWLFS